MPETAPTPNRRWSGLTRFAKSPSRVYPLVFLLTYVVLFGYYDLRQVPKQRAALLSQDFRRLALASDQIRSRIENLALLMEAQADRDQEKASAEKSAPGHHYDAKPESTTVVSNFAYAPCDENQAVKQGISFVVMPGDDSVIHAQIVKGDVHLCGDSPLKSTIEGATSNLIGGAFEDVAMVTSSGRVIYQFQSSALRLASLGTLGQWATPPAKATAEATQTGATATSSTGKQAPAAPHDGIDYSRTIDLSFAEHDYKLLLQPIVLPVADFASNTQNDGKPSSLALVGVVDENVLTARARALPYATLINLTAVILLALVMTWPVLKIWKMGPAESFRPRETLAFGLSLIVATWLLTVGIIYDIQVFNYESTDRGLDGLARKIEGNFKSEIEAALKTLQRVSSSKPVADELVALRGAKPGLRFTSRQNILDGHQQINAVEMAAEYPWFDQIFWSDDKGEQVLKWSTQHHATGRTRVSSSPWFAKVKNGRFWWLDSSGSPAGPRPLVLDSVYSPNTADYFGIVTRPVDVAGEQLIATLVTPFISVIEPLLRPSDGFAILDETGLVRFHSDAGKNLRENFLNELAPSQELRTAIGTAAKLRFTAQYNGNRVRLLARPLAILRNSTWTLIVFRDLTLKQRFFLNTLVLTILYSLAYFVALALLARLGMKAVDRLARRAGHPKADWYRPSERERVLLWALAGCLTLLLCAFRLFSLLNVRLPVYLLAILALPLTGILLSYFALRYPAATGWLYRAGSLPSRHRWKAAKVSVLGATLLLVLLSVFPAVELFEIAFNDSVLANMEDAQIGLARNIRQRSERVYAYCRRISYGSGGTAVQPDPGFLERRLAETRDRYTLPAPCGQTEAASRGEWASWWLPRAERLRWSEAVGEPQASWLFRHTANLLKNFIPFPETVKAPVPGESPWTWKFSQTCAGVPELDLLLTRDDPQDTRAGQGKSVADFPVVSAIPAYPNLPAGPLLILVLVVFLYQFVHYTVLRRLALDFVPSAAPWESIALQNLLQDVGRNALSLDLPRHTDAKTIAAMDVSGVCQTFELSEMLRDKDWETRICACTRLIVITGLQAGIKDQDLNEQTLAIIERIVEEPNRKLLLISTIDPIYYLYQGQLRDVQKLQRGELECYSRWMNALNSFEVYRMEQNPGKTLGREEWHLLWDSCAPREQLALWQLAHDSIVNPNNTSAIEHLYRRGLVHHDRETGHFRIFDLHFQNFVLSELPQRQMELLMRSNKDTAWNGLKWAMIYTGLALPLFLAFTAADFWDLGFGKLLTIGSAGAAAIQTFTKIAELAGARVSKSGTG